MKRIVVKFKERRVCFVFVFFPPKGRVAGAHTNSPYDIASKRRKESTNSRKKAELHSAQTNTVRGEKSKGFSAGRMLASFLMPHCAGKKQQGLMGTQSDLTGGTAAGLAVSHLALNIQTTTNESE